MKVKHSAWIAISVVVWAIAVHADVATPNWDAAAKSWWAHVQYLAGDSLEGRETGSHGFELAAAYVQDQFKQAGLKPAGPPGYFESVAFMSPSPTPLNQAGNWCVINPPLQLFSAR